MHQLKNVLQMITYVNVLHMYTYIHMLIFLFSFGSAIVVESLSRLTQTIFGTTNLCFVQYHDSSASPYTWRNVRIYNGSN